ncbi:uncharacterized protein LOC117792041 [Drosophila innubila]|uniref:uncharacterized protein LOC117792041 n=1 Tax=Drosophila innubila TaxID=198719 RepID=UPI00148DA1DE|nr:uncharacterized protein LOC117792041 [Drosophila innubila]
MSLYICRKHIRPSFLHRQIFSTNAFPELNLGLGDYDPLQESEASDSCSASDEEPETNVSDDGDEVTTNCKVCKLQQQIDDVRLKIAQLEQRLYLNEDINDDDEEEENIRPLIK